MPSIKNFDKKKTADKHDKRKANGKTASRAEETADKATDVKHEIYIKSGEKRDIKSDTQSGETMSANTVSKRRPGREGSLATSANIEAGPDSVKVIDVELGEVTNQVSEGGLIMETHNSNKKTEVGMEDSNMQSAKGAAQGTAEPEIESESNVSADDGKSKIEIQFPGSELLRSKYPQPFDVAEAVATDWMNNGKFQDIPIQNPVAKNLAAQGLTKAKELEQKILTSPTTEKVAMQAFTYAMKIQGALTDIKSKISKK